MSEEQGLLVQPIVPQPPNAMSMIQLAVQRGATFEEIKALLDLRKELETDEARKAFNQAFAAFKANPPRLTKNKEVDFTSQKGRTHYKHASLDGVADAIGQELSKHGLSFRWSLEQGAKIKVTCILQHAMGHSESVTLEAPPDATGNKNTIQEIGSTVTYLQRYTLLSATGMATADQDDDGAATSVDPEQVEYLSNCKDLAELQRLFSSYYAEAKAAKNQRAMKALIDAKDQRKRELQ